MQRRLRSISTLFFAEHQVRVNSLVILYDRSHAIIVCSDNMGDPNIGPESAKAFFIAFALDVRMPTVLRTGAGSVTFIHDVLGLLVRM